MRTKVFGNFKRYLHYFLLVLFSILCGLFLTQLSIVFYFEVFPPIPKTLVGFYIAVALIILALGVVIYRLFKRGKTSIAVWVIVTGFILFVFGVPIFMVENNHMLWHQDPFGVGPDYLIDFSATEVEVLKFIYYDLYISLVKKIREIALCYIFIYLGISLYRWRKSRHKRGLSS